MLKNSMWDFIVNKAPLNLPKLNVKSQNEKELEVLLKPIESMILPSDSDSDASSDIVDVFGEFTKDSFLRPLPGTRMKFLSKLEADRRTVDQFTADFKNTMQELRRNLNLDDLMTTESEKDIENVLNSNEKYIFVDSITSTPVEERISLESEHLDSEITSNSAVWNMIKAHRKPYFYASPPHYDIYNVDPDHYLKRPHVSWKQVDESRNKCQKWLEEQCEND